MAEDSEKRFNAVMDKLFYAPRISKSKSTTTDSSSLSGVQLSRGLKRPNMSSALRVREVQALHNSSVPGGPLQVPLCRPWDRGDLQKRLATFKSMTWFAKPEAVSAVNCARRGWVNVDSDIIACEACGARLLFSTPSSWTQHQVEKAAIVFSLKLDNGHKLLCPWVDNACDEALSQFPPTPAAVLVDNYKKRCAALLQLFALPVISSSAIDYMRSPQVDNFLKEYTNTESINKSADASSTEYLGHESETVSSFYYQALKLISLCGWEPRLLPYFVDYKDGEDLFDKEASHLDPPREVSNGQSPSIRIYSSGSNENLETNDDSMASGVKYDPTSVVLDCQLCGASVGLWTFSSISRPVEFIRLVGEVNGENGVAQHKEKFLLTDAENSGSQYLDNENNVEARENAMNSSTTGTSSADEVPLKLNLTIAGGPPPAKQNFRPTISLPVIGRNLRARFSSDFEFGDHQSFKTLFQKDRDQAANALTGQQGFELGDTRLAHVRIRDEGQCKSTSNDLFPCLNSQISETQALRNDINCTMLLDGTNISEQGIPETNRPESSITNPLENSPNVEWILSELDILPEKAAICLSSGPDEGDVCNSQVGNSTISTSGCIVSIANGETIMNDSLALVANESCHIQRSSCTEIICSKQGDVQDDQGVVTKLQSPNNNIKIGNNINKPLLAKQMEFDPIRQHRHFCPWIVSSGSSDPGWQQTLSAIQRQKEYSSPSSTNSPSSSLIKVDDPVSSIKKLFMSPSPKRAKLSHGSS